MLVLSRATVQTVDMFPRIPWGDKAARQCYKRKVQDILAKATKLHRLDISTDTRSGYIPPVCNRVRCSLLE